MENISLWQNISQEDKKYIKTYVDDFCQTSLMLENVGACVGVFGSAIFDEKNRYYNDAEKISYILGKNGFNIISGGSGGIMEAANKGAKLANCGESIGINIVLPDEQIPNIYTTKETTVSSFGVRKHFLIKNLTSCVIFPGGFGTLDELFDVLALVRTRSILPVSIHLFGVEFWQPFIDFVNKSLILNKTISNSDLEMLHVSDDLDEITSKVKEHIKDYLNVMRESSLHNSKRYKLIHKQFGL